MATVDIDGTPVELDEDGHLVDTGAWNENIAVELARRASISQLTDDHWRVISNHCGVTPRQMFRLYPGRRPLQIAATVAGVPEPHEYIGGCGINWWSPWR